MDDRFAVLLLIQVGSALPFCACTGSLASQELLEFGEGSAWPSQETDPPPALRFALVEATGHQR